MSSTYKRRRQENKEGTEKNYKHNQKAINKTAMTTYLTKITLNVNGLNAPIKNECIKKRWYTYTQWNITWP